MFHLCRIELNEASTLDVFFFGAALSQLHRAQISST